MHLSKAYRTVIPFSSIRQIRERKQIFPFDISVKKNNKCKTSPWFALSLMMSVVHMPLYRYKKGLVELFKTICNQEERKSSSDILYISISWGIQRLNGNKCHDFRHNYLLTNFSLFRRTHFYNYKIGIFYNWFPGTSTHFPVQNYQLINYQFIVVKKLKTGTISIIESLCI